MPPEIQRLIDEAHIERVGAAVHAIQNAPMLGLRFTPLAIRHLDYTEARLSIETGGARHLLDMRDARLAARALRAERGGIWPRIADLIDDAADAAEARRDDIERKRQIRASHLSGATDRYYARMQDGPDDAA